jgi:hypothetical protein
MTPDIRRKPALLLDLQEFLQAGLYFFGLVL